MEKLISKSLNSIKILFLLTGFFSLHAQEYTLSGTIKDTLQNPLANTNVLAIPQSEDENIAFSISDEKGGYKLNLNNGTPYNIEIRYLGFKQINDTVTLFQNQIKNYQLLPSNETLEEVILKQKLAIKVRKDTIIYQTDVFTTGEERKLREVLKKLPGVEVDREGNVKVNGKKVDKLLVDGKTFFTGDTKLGVNNIPADAIGEVEVLDNYSEIAFLKGLNDSNILAMNIKLKEGKKNFVFGDVEAASGYEDRYQVHSSLFYYSPKTNVTLIGELNNTGKKAFTFSDYLNFEGGFSKIIDDPSGYASLFNSDFAASLLNEDFTFGKNEFGAFNLSHQISAKTSVSAYSIVNNSKTETRQEDAKTFFTNNEITANENRITTGSNTNFLSLNKVSLKYIASLEDDLTYEAIIKTSSGSSFENLQSNTLEDTNFVNTNAQPTSFELLQTASYSTQFSYKHTSTITANLDVRQSDAENNWSFTQPIFSNILTLEGATPFNFIQQQNTRNYKANIGIKHYWILNNFNHIYPIVGASYSKQEFRTEDFQQMQTGTNSFDATGFNNNVAFGLSDTYVGFQYKTKLKDVIIKPGIIFHKYAWQVDQFNEEQVNRSKGQFLPEFLMRWDIKSSEKFTVKYNLVSQFNDASFYGDRLQLQGFNSLYRGNVNLENALRHQASVRYYKFSLIKGLFYNAGVNYSNAINSIRNTTVLEGIDQINTAIYTTLPESTWSFNGSISKKIKRIKGTLQGTLSFSDYSRLINDAVVNYTSQNINYTAKVETYFKNYPNLEVGLNQSYSQFSSVDFENNFTKTNPYAVLEYDFLNDFILKADYNFTRYINKATNAENDFEMGNASLFYNKEDSPWGFELNMTNIFDIEFKNQNSFNQFVISDTKNFVQPRMILFKVNYKL